MAHRLLLDAEREHDLREAQCMLEISPDWIVVTAPAPGRVQIHAGGRPPVLAVLTKHWIDEMPSILRQIAESAG